MGDLIYTHTRLLAEKDLFYLNIAIRICFVYLPTGARNFELLLSSVGKRLLIGFFFAHLLLTLQRPLLGLLVDGQQLSSLAQHFQQFHNKRQIIVFASYILYLQ